MSATEITKVSIPHTSAGYNLTDSASFSTLSTGAGNGVKFTWEEDLVVVLKNDTIGAAVFTVVIPTQARLSAYSASVTSPTLSVAAGKTYLARLDSIFKNVSTNYVTIECDVAGKVLVLDPSS